MPVPLPATDAQLRQAAERAVKRWIDETGRALRDRWTARPGLDQALAAVPEGPRRSWWAEVLRGFADQRTHRFPEAAAPRRAEATGQVLEILRSREPRLTGEDLVRPTAAGLEALAALAAATEVGQDLTALAVAVDAELAEFVARAVQLEDLRSRKVTALAAVCGPLLARIAQADAFEARIAAADRPALLLAWTGPALAARAAARAAVDIRRVSDTADRALRLVSDAAFAERQQALSAPFDVAADAIGPADAAFSEAWDTLGEAVHIHHVFFRTWEDPALGWAEQFAGVYGYTGLLAMHDLDPYLVERALRRLDGSQGWSLWARFQEYCPTDSPRQRIADALTELNEVQPRFPGGPM
ncbi:hypothetical protein [Streptomyces sp. RKAG293]|uniref:hypothetical protein n=1 Tax=Streptomyces sp. RKAG293 TaxID=2893403 RepID=UPI002033EC5C|nr:hypothetical protein [Streptomyces sp. RKAG293]MCM2422688.1 hypothetical protein [Streptomyces sp. RKAG293]